MIIMQILVKVLASNKEANTSLGSSKSEMIFLAALCCLVFNILMSLLFSENKATSAPEITKLNNSKTPNTLNKIGVWTSMASKIYNSGSNEKFITEWVSKKKGFGTIILRL